MPTVPGRRYLLCCLLKHRLCQRFTQNILLRTLETVDGFTEDIGMLCAIASCQHSRFTELNSYRVWKISAILREEVFWVWIHLNRPRRLHYDLIMWYKIVFNIVKLKFTDFFSFIPVTATRGHPYRLFVPFAENTTRKNFFAHRVLLNLGITCRLMLLISVH